MPESFINLKDGVVTLVVKLRIGERVILEETIKFKESHSWGSCHIKFVKLISEYFFSSTIGSRGDYQLSTQVLF